MIFFCPRTSKCPRRFVQRGDLLQQKEYPTPQGPSRIIASARVKVIVCCLEHSLVDALNIAQPLIHPLIGLLPFSRFVPRCKKVTNALDCLQPLMELTEESTSSYTGTSPGTGTASPEKSILYPGRKREREPLEWPGVCSTCSFSPQANR